MVAASETPQEAANRQWEETYGTVTSLLAALTRIENHIRAGRTEAALKLIDRARHTAARNKLRDEEARVRNGQVASGS